MIHTVIFDFDGTLADTLDIFIAAYNKIASRYALDAIDPAQKEFLRNFGARELIRKYRISPSKLMTLTRRMRSQLKKEGGSTSFFEGIDTLFQDLKRKGFRIGIVTSNSEEKVKSCLEKWHISSDVDFIHSERNIFGKAKAFSHVLKKYSLSKEEVIYVGDEVRDIEAAHQVGIPIISVTWGFNSKERLAQSQPEHLALRPSEILEIVSAHGAV